MTSVHNKFTHRKSQRLPQYHSPEGYWAAHDIDRPTEARGHDPSRLSLLTYGSPLSRARAVTVLTNLSRRRSR